MGFPGFPIQDWPFFLGWIPAFSTSTSVWCSHSAIKSTKRLVNGPISSPPHLIALTIPWANEEVKIPWRLHGDHETHLDGDGDSPRRVFFTCLKWTNFCTVAIPTSIPSFCCAKCRTPMLEPRILIFWSIESRFMIVNSRFLLISPTCYF